MSEALQEMMWEEQQRQRRARDPQLEDARRRLRNRQAHDYAEESSRQQVLRFEEESVPLVTDTDPHGDPDVEAMKLAAESAQMLAAEVLKRTTSVYAKKLQPRVARWEGLFQRHPWVENMNVERQQQLARPLFFMDRIFAILEVVLPPRLVREDLGDSIESIQARIGEGRSGRWVVFTVLFAAFWLSVNGVREGMSALTGKEKKSTPGATPPPSPPV